MAKPMTVTGTSAAVEPVEPLHPNNDGHHGAQCHHALSGPKLNVKT